MKIVAICQRSYFGATDAGGAERMLHALLSHLVVQGWEAEAVITNYTGDPIVVDGVTVYNVRGERNIRQAVVGADVIITHLSTSMIAKRVGRDSGIPVVQLIHNTNEYTRGFLGSGCDMAVYNSEWVRDFHGSNQLGIIQEVESKHSVALKVRKSSTWPYVVVRPPVVSPDLRQPGGPDGYVTLVNLVPNKGPDVFYEMARRNPRLKFRGVVGGYEPHDQVFQFLPNVEIHPHIRDMSSIYGQASIVLMPSKYESYGMVAVEALQYGVPAITSPTPGLQEALGSSGWFRDRDDLDAWDKALRWSLDNYDARSGAAHQRHLELYEQSQQDLRVFCDTMNGVARGDYRD